jgi:hypothetical protein
MNTRCENCKNNNPCLNCGSYNNFKPKEETTSEKLIEAIKGMTGEQLMNGELECKDCDGKIRNIYGYKSNVFLIDNTATVFSPTVNKWTYPIPKKKNSEIIEVGQVWKNIITQTTITIVCISKNRTRFVFEDYSGNLVIFHASNLDASGWKLKENG